MSRGTRLLDDRFQRFVKSALTRVNALVEQRSVRVNDAAHRELVERYRKSVPESKRSVSLYDHILLCQKYEGRRLFRSQKYYTYYRPLGGIFALYYLLPLSFEDKIGLAMFPTMLALGWVSFRDNSPYSEYLEQRERIRVDMRLYAKEE